MAARCPTCNALDPDESEFCSDGFHAPGETYWPPEPTPSRSAVSEELKAMSPDYRRGWFGALDHVCHFINSLDSSDMTVREVRSAIYGECLGSRPTPDLGEDRELVRLLAEKIGSACRSEAFPSAATFETKAERVLNELLLPRLESLHAEMGRK